MNIKKIKSLKMTGICFISCAIISCQKDDVPTIPQNSNVDESVISTLTKMGFNTGVMAVSSYQDYYLVEGDILIKKKDIEENNSNINLRADSKKKGQARTDYSVTSTNAHNINIIMDESIWGNPRWYHGLYKAISVWNSVPGSNLKLNILDITDANLYNVRKDIIITGDNNTLASNVAASAAFPTFDGKPGEKIIVNSDYNISYPGNAVWNIIHEIGHCIGLRHTNWYFRGESGYPYGAIDIPNTPSSLAGDQLSIMNGGTADFEFNMNQNNLPSNYDIIATKYLYPLIATSSVNSYITGASTVGKYGQNTYRLSYASDEAGINYKWEVNGINGLNYYYHYNNNTSYTLDEITFDVAGQYQLKCTISGGKYNSPRVITKVITVS